MPFYKHKLIKNCSYIIQVKQNDINIKNKNNIPIMLMVINKETDSEKFETKHKYIFINTIKLYLSTLKQSS